MSKVCTFVMRENVGFVVIDLVVGKRFVTGQ